MDEIHYIVKDVSIFDGLPIYVKELIAGGGAGAFAKTVIAPLERILKCEGVVGFYKGNGASVILRIILFRMMHWYRQRKGGLHAQYRGIGPTLVGIFPYSALKFYIYEEIKRRALEDHQRSILMHLSCGALAIAYLDKHLRIHWTWLGGRCRLKAIIYGTYISINYMKIVPSTTYDAMKAWLLIRI
ncbi:hypothetical protein H5410_000421 [Solanum commersonii]|uniref:Uncharacterized protein n=1 Tax=Solanum commersonii TaxID=4109 RepID=A0A9J6AW37_SOLCO|nr:hypothetical protein H5410_000421 [Solanum commersonii]